MEQFPLKTQQMFSVQTTRLTNLKMQQSPVILNLFGQGNHIFIMCRDAIVFEKFRFQNVLGSHNNEKPTFSNSSGFQSVFENGSVFVTD